MGDGPPLSLPTEGHNFLDSAIEGLRGLLGSSIPGIQVPNTTAGHVGELLGAAAPLFRLPNGKLLKGGMGGDIGGMAPKFQIIEGEQADRALNALKTTPPVQAITSPDELGDITQAPKTPAPTRKPLVQDSAARQSGMAPQNSKLNVTDVQRIKGMSTQGAKIADIVKEYPGISTSTISAIVKGDSWAWVK